MYRPTTRSEDGRPRRQAAGVLAGGLAAAIALTLPAAHASPDTAGRDSAPAQATAKQDGIPPHAVTGESGKPADTSELQVLALNDFHGALEPPSGSDGEVIHETPDGGTETVEAGGVAHLATALRAAREDHDRSVTVAAGDMIGGTPLVSGIFHDEPTIEALNALDMDVAGVGNHEFDAGWEELLRKQHGGCHPEDGCFVEDREFDGADFPYLAANVVHEDSGEPVLPPYSVQELDGVRVGFIGVTLEGTANIVAEEGIEGLEFLGEAETLDRYAAELQEQGVNAVIALVHEGGYPDTPTADFACDADGEGLSGPIVEIAEETTPLVDALVTGHTHQPYVCALPDPDGQDRLVTSAQSNGRLFTELTMEYDHDAENIVRTSVEGTNQVVHRDHERAPDLVDLISFWQELAEPIAQEPVGWIADDLPQSGDPESVLGNVIADAQLAHARGLDETAEIALMNPGGIRADLTYPESGDEGDGVVTYGEAFAVQPFSNQVHLVDLTGEQLLDVLREQVSGENEESTRILQPSEGFTYTLDLTESGEQRIVADSVTVHDEPLEADREYRVAVNSFLAGGGDGFPTLAEHGDPLVGGSDLEALTDYFAEVSAPDNPLPAPDGNRITVVE